MAEHNPHGRFEWHRRRRLIYYTLIFCMLAAASLIWAGLGGMDSTLLNTLTVSNYGLAGAVIGSYVFGAVWDDRNARVYGDDYTGDIATPPTDIPPSGTPG